jgi:hypothetical protein
MVQYNPSSASFIITWAALYVDTILTATPSTTTPLQGELVTVAGKLTRQDTGAPIEGANVELWHGDHMTGTLLTSTATNAMGNYSIQWTSMFEGPVAYEVYFPGMTAPGLTYSPSSGGFTTAAAMNPLLIVGLLAAAALLMSRK